VTKTPWQTHIDPIRLAVDARIDDLIAGWQGHPLLLEAMAYAVRAGGKRMRPILASATCQAFGGRAADALDLGCAVELIHAYSLVHDDLPSMDNDLLRRGLPTVHVKYGEAMGILVGDALQAAAFDRAGAASAPADPTRKLRAVLALADASGAAGMVGGQVRDIRAESATAEQVLQLHAEKTGALFRVSALMGAICANADEVTIGRAIRFGELLGRAFQVGDDLEDALDVGGSGGAHEALVNYALAQGIEPAIELVASDVAGCRELLGERDETTEACHLIVDWVEERAAAAAAALRARS
jgi:geranylgeranyl pyrophosphate synthase